LGMWESSFCTMTTMTAASIMATITSWYKYALSAMVSRPKWWLWWWATVMTTTRMDTTNGWFPILMRRLKYYCCWRIAYPSSNNRPAGWTPERLKPGTGPSRRWSLRSDMNYTPAWW
jgi:hypothetical protein